MELLELYSAVLSLINEVRGGSTWCQRYRRLMQLRTHSGYLAAQAVPLGFIVIVGALSASLWLTKFPLPGSSLTLFGVFSNFHEGLILYLSWHQFPPATHGVTLRDGPDRITLSQHANFSRFSYFGGPIHLSLRCKPLSGHMRRIPRRIGAISKPMTLLAASATGSKFECIALQRRHVSAMTSSVAYVWRRYFTTSVQARNIPCVALCVFDDDVGFRQRRVKSGIKRALHEKLKQLHGGSLMASICVMREHKRGEKTCERNRIKIIKHVRFHLHL